MPKFTKKLIEIFLVFVFLFPKAAYSSLSCSDFCSYDNFFMKNYQKLNEYLNPSAERLIIFNMLYEAYSIKFKTLDYERDYLIKTLQNEEYEACCNEIWKELRNINEIAIEEYDSFLDDLNFELCEDETSEFKFIKKHKKKYRKELKKLISKNCKQ